MPRLVNRAKMTTFTTGTGTLTLGSAVNGFQTFAAAGVNDGNVVHYVIEDGASWEIGSGTYTSAVDPDSFLVSSYLSRNVIESSASGALLNLSGSAVVYISALATDVETNTTISRAFMVSAIAEGFVPEDGNSYLLDGLVYIGTAGATAIPDLPGLLPAKPVSVSHFGADGSGATDATAAVTAANAYAVATDSSVVIAGGTFATISAINFTAPVVFESGGVLKPTSTVTFTATLEAGNWQIFDLSDGGSIVASGRVAQVNALWWGMSQAANTATATANANAINNALKTRRPVLLPPTSPNRGTGWPVQSGIITVTDQNCAVIGHRGSFTVLNQYGSGHLFTIQAAYFTAEWLEIYGNRDLTGALSNNLTDGFPFYLDTAATPIILGIVIRNIHTWNTWGFCADAKQDLKISGPGQWFFTDIECDLVRGPGFDFGDGRGSLFWTNVALGRGASSRTLTTVANEGGGAVRLTANVPHGFVAGNQVGIAGTTNYNGVYTILATPTPYTFTVTKAFVAETLSGATATSFVSHFNHPMIRMRENQGSNMRNVNLVGTSEDQVSSGSQVIAYPNQHGVELINCISASFDGLYADHTGGSPFYARILPGGSSFNLVGTRMHLDYGGTVAQMRLEGVTRSRFHVEWMRGIPISAGGPTGIDGVRMDAACTDVTVYGGTALAITNHAFNIAGDRCSVFDWSLQMITNDGIRYANGATGVSSNLRFRDAPGAAYARIMGAGPRVLNVERETGTFDNLCHAAALTTPGTGSTQLDGPVGVGQYTVAGKPAASTFAGHVIYLTNETGGATLAYSDGTNWRRVYDNAVAS